MHPWRSNPWRQGKSTKLGELDEAAGLAEQQDQGACPLPLLQRLLSRPDLGLSAALLFGTGFAAIQVSNSARL